jgi:V/A-type H+-transporting ATPase subunit E
MSVETIIAQINQDAEQEISRINQEVKKKAQAILDAAKKDAQDQAEQLLAKGKQQSDNLKKILISKANQEAKRDLMRAKEDVIDECFAKAFEQLSNLPEKTYTSMVTRLIEQSRKKLGHIGSLLISQEIDKNIAKTMKIPVEGTIKATGGVVLQSPDKTVTLDNTFEGILKRNKDTIRNKVGKLLFS